MHSAKRLDLQKILPGKIFPLYSFACSMLLQQINQEREKKKERKKELLLFLLGIPQSHLLPDIYEDMVMQLITEISVELERHTLKCTFNQVGTLSRT